MSMKKILLTVCLIFTALAVYSQNKTYFVSLDGNDNASGLSIKDAVEKSG